MIGLKSEHTLTGLGYTNATAKADPTNGNDHAQFPNHEKARAPTKQPIKKPTTAGSVLFKRSCAPFVTGSPPEIVSSRDMTILVVLKVITDVEGAPGSVRGNSVN